VRRGGYLALLFTVIAAAMAMGAPTASAAPWSCNAFGYLFQAPTGVAPGIVQQVDLATGEYTQVGETADVVNAVAFNPVDNNVYAWDTTTEEIVRIESDLSIVPLGVPAGVNAAEGYNVGDVDTSGHYWMQNSASGNWFEIELTPTPTVLKSGTATPPAGYVNGADWAAIGGYLYKVSNNIATHVPHLFRFDPATGIEEDVTPGGLGFTAVNNEGNADGAGAVYADAAGYLYASFNSSGQIWRINPVTHQAIKASNGPPAGSNDGARCVLAPIPTVTVIKTVEGGRGRPADQFTVGLINPKGEAVESATTSGTGTTATTTNFPASQGKTYTITDSMAPGSASKIGEYVQSIKCTDTNGNAAPTGGTAGNWTLNIAAATEYTCKVTNASSADLEAAKSASPSTAVPGENETYTLTIKNKGPSPAREASITDPLPAGVTFVSADPGCTFAGGTVTCSEALLAAGASKSFKVVTKVASSVDHRIKNTATVHSPTPDPEPKNNESTTETPVGPKTDLQMTKTASAASATVGGQVMYTLVVQNNGPSDATGVTVEDTLPSGLTLVSAQPSQGSCSGTKCQLGTLAAGGSAQVLVTANVTGGGGSSVKNTAKVTGDQPDPDPGNNEDGSTVEIKPGPEPTFDLSVKKTANVKNPTIGQQVTYTIAVENSGPQAAPEAKVTDTLNKRVKVISVKPETGKCTTGNPFTCQLGTIQPGKTVKIKAVVQVLRLGGQRNAASVMGDGKDTEPSNNLSVLKQRVNKVKLKLTKVASKANVHPGEKFSYLITVKNITKGVARKVQVCDEMPSGLAYLSSNPKGKFGKGALCWTTGTLGAKATEKFTVVVKALRASGTKVNRVTASGGAVAAAKAKSVVHVAPAPEKPTPVTG
jgi:uncharacterized repeat protein (TIGR01451 family)